MHENIKSLDLKILFKKKKKKISRYKKSKY